MVNTLTSLMTSEFHKPGDIVIMQNDSVQENGEFIPSACVFFFVDGFYRRMSLQFDQRHKLSNLLDNKENLILRFDEGIVKQDLSKSIK